MNKHASQQRTAQTLGAIFGTRAPEVLQDVSRNKPTITRKNKHGAAVQMLTFNEAKALLAAQGKVFETNGELEKALWNGTKFKKWRFVARLIFESDRCSDQVCRLITFHEYPK